MRQSENQSGHLKGALRRAHRYERWLTRRLGLNRFDAWRSAPYSSIDSPIIIGGCRRSGTTLLRVILDSHPAICCGPESGLFLPRSPDLRRLAELFDFSLSDLKQLRHESGSQGEFIDRLFSAYRTRAGRVRWAEKTPQNISVMDFIFDRFPNARFIHMIRDGRDVVCSLRKHLKLVGKDVVPVEKEGSFSNAITRWERAIHTGMQFRNDSRYVELKYEDLVLEPERCLRRIFEFIGEDYEPSVLEFHRRKSPSRGVSKFPHNPRAVEPMSTDSIGRWRTELTPEQRAELWDRVGKLLVQLGYASDDRWVNP